MSSWKDSVRAATTVALNPFPPTNLLTIDGVAVNAGDRVLVKDQQNQAQNGIWVAAATGSWQRASDANTSALVTPEMTVRVSEGTNNAHTLWILMTQGSIVLETTALPFVRIPNLVYLPSGYVGFSGSSASDSADIFTITNTLSAESLDRSDNPTAYLTASLAGLGGFCTGVHGRNGNGSQRQPNVGVGVYADSDNGYGIYGSSNTNAGVYGSSNTNAGVYGESQAFDGAKGVSHSNQHAGVSGLNDAGGSAVWGSSTTGIGVQGISQGLDGVQGVSHSSQHAGVAGHNDGGGSGVWRCVGNRQSRRKLPGRCYDF